MMNQHTLNRRDVLRGMAVGVAGVAAMGFAQDGATDPGERTMATLKGRIRQSVSRWCYNKIPPAEFYQACRDMGLLGVDLIGPADWPLLREFGLVGTCTPSHSLTKGLNRTANHEECLAKIRASIEATAAAGFPNVVCFSGNREGISDEEGEIGRASCRERV